MTHRTALTRRRGVSLVEALVAMAVMSFGMLALVGVQTTMRLNSDVAKQRGEATRIATEEIENLRGFRTMGVVQGQPDTAYDEILTRTVDAYQAPDAIGNTTYTVVRTIRDAAGTQQKSVSVQVRWTDRSNQPQTVTLETVISGTDPALAGLLSRAPTHSAINQIGGRHNSIPVEAVDIGGNRSAFKPFDRGTVVWVFNNTTGLITRRCPAVAVAQASITAAIVEACAGGEDLAIEGRLLAGHVQFDHRNPWPDPQVQLVSEDPQGPVLPLDSLSPLAFSNPLGQSMAAECLADSPVLVSDVRPAFAYFCLVHLSQLDVEHPDRFGWGGKLDLNLVDRYPEPAPNGTALQPPGTTAADFKVCRYTTALTDRTLNANHPMTYCVEAAGALVDGCNGRRITRNLINQNFLVIPAIRACPEDQPDSQPTPLINGNTRQHQP